MTDGRWNTDARIVDARSLPVPAGTLRFAHFCIHCNDGSSMVVPAVIKNEDRRLSRGTAKNPVGVFPPL
jgi:hypothetical protein